MSTGVIRYAEHEYDNPIPRVYGVIDFVDFICSYLVVEPRQHGTAMMPGTGMMPCPTQVTVTCEPVTCATEQIQEKEKPKSNGNVRSYFILLSFVTISLFISA
ncbi:hypothetical protein Y032_0064g3500 [Ancylostoma ceylanicum]|uniref:Uncharacterized protein n=1 Tax=Ancylostoma ceylanicum TaxID=53326 RepID=A0A016U1I8_9BILA|nr:hypothetical protein Y032_0064g3500 [Ancylostoma ceylanicum]